MPVQNERELLAALDAVLAERRAASPDSSYVAALYAEGLNKILEKLGEEATEVILAAKDSQQDDGGNAEHGDAQLRRQALVGEVADLWFHSLVLLSERGLSSADVLACLAERFGVSGHAEKASRQQGAIENQ